MKKLGFILVLFFICQVLFGQMVVEDRLEYDFTPYIRDQLMWEQPTPWKPVLIIGVLTTSIVLEAIGDAKYDMGDKYIGKMYQSLSLAVLFALPFILDENDSWWAVAASYICFRIALFDPAYNLTRGLPIGYIGNTSYWDKGLQAFNPPVGGQMWGRSMILIVGVSIPIKHFR